MGQCAKCGESNHVTARCRHRDKVQCRVCGSRGHKEKHHTEHNYRQVCGRQVVAMTTDINYSLDNHTKWHFPTLINLNARSLSTEKIDELRAIVDLYNVSIIMYN